ncbi:MULTISPECIES: hypothetical protein [Sphingobacterium]|uniref:hypothetical protein n=1 Tax=Sphingobacterium TaxID=28453 RepID=UPI00257F4E00|nr:MULTISPECIES: hypothetical protein [Sphingobacterium]
MSLLNRIFPWLLLSLFSIACARKNDALSPDHNAIAAEIKTLEDQRLNAANGDSIKLAWLKLDQHATVKKDTVLAARVKYYLARLYAMSGQDSALFLFNRRSNSLNPPPETLNTKLLFTMA